MNGYSDKLIAIDDEMVALGRPAPPCVTRVKATREHIRGKPDVCPCPWCRACRDWQAQLEAWREANPEADARWEELNAQYAAQDELERRAKWDGSDDSWNYALLDSIGVPESNLQLIKPDRSGNIAARENGSMRAAREWLLDGTAWCLTVIGRPQCGKSTGAAWLAHQLLMRRFRPVWVDCPKQSEAPMYGAGAEFTRFKCRNAASLVLDDLGGGRRERESEFWGAWLDDIIGTRANERRKTVITTNRSEAELSTWLGPRLFARLQAGVIRTTADASMRRG